MYDLWSFIISLAFCCLSFSVVYLTVRVRRLESWRDLITQICNDAQAEESDYA